MPSLFISDLHLDASHAISCERFDFFLTHIAPQADALYILGDLFDYWIGDDDPRAFIKPIRQALKQLSQHTPIYFIAGNRDFLIGKRFAQQSGIKLLPDPSVIDLYGQDVLLMHGDTLCTDDVEYLRVRHWVRKAWVKAMFLCLPLAFRRRYAKGAKQKSQQHKQATPLAIMDVTQQAVDQALRQHHCRVLIHGHTHRPAIHSVQLNQQAAERIVLAAWHDQGNYLIWHDNGQHELCYF